MAVFLNLAIHSSAVPRVSRVPSEFSTIQQAINAAGTSETVLVAPGVYQPFDLQGKRITVAAEGTNHAAIIQTPGTLAGVTCFNNESTSTVIRGFTIVGGAIGFNIRTASPTLVDNIITNCVLGIQINGSSANIVSNRITRASTAGISLTGGFFSVIRNNQITLNGVGIALGGGEPTIENNVIALNVVEGIGVGGDSDPIIRQNVIYGNGGISVLWLTPQGRRDVVLVQNTIIGSSTPNVPAVSGAGFQPGTLIANNIIVGRPAMEFSYMTAGGVPVVGWNLFYAPDGPVIGGDSSSTGITNQNQNMVGEPRFLDPEIGEFELTAGSLGIDVGTSTNAPATDFLGVPRPADGNSDGTALNDLGAFEFVPGPPRRPRSLTGVATSDVVLLDWRATDLATGYLVERSTNASGPFTAISFSAETAFADAQAIRDIQYFYRVSGSNSFGLGSASALIQIKAGNFPPVAKADLITVREDSPIDFFPLLNDADQNNEPLRIVRLELPLPVGVVLIGTDTIRYSPPVNLANTNFTFGYVITDDRGAFSTNLVTLRLVPVNDLPVVENQSFIVPGNTNSTLALHIVDPDSSEFDLIVDQAPIHGTIVPRDRGRFEYRPVWGYSGPDFAMVRISDREGMSEAVSVTLTVTALADIDADRIADVWENFWDLNNPLADLDQDGMNNLQEYFANTSPRSAQSLLEISRIQCTPEGSIAVSWKAVGSNRYRIYSTDSLNAPFSPIPLGAQSEIDAGFYGVEHERTYIDTRPISSTGARFYKVEVVQ